uniref:Uncharacterized protein n=1 Tax=Arundo donax TaxID=35708 RepID=A0A0A9G8U5_ARUDO
MAFFLSNVVTVPCIYVVGKEINNHRWNLLEDEFIDMVNFLVAYLAEDS